jgi:hypothetical protein
VLPRPGPPGRSRLKFFENVLRSRVVRSTPPLLALVVATSGCLASRVPDPRDAAASYAAAAKRGDADEIYDMLSEKGRRTLSRAEVRKIVADERAELADAAKALTSPGIVVKARARVRYADGEDTSLELDDQGVFRIGAADALPAGARTPEQALENAGAGSLVLDPLELGTIRLGFEQLQLSGSS